MALATAASFWARWSPMARSMGSTQGSAFNADPPVRLLRARIAVDVEAIAADRRPLSNRFPDGRRQLPHRRITGQRARERDRYTSTGKDFGSALRRYRRAASY
jgi:hypothetical protein